MIFKVITRKKKSDDIIDDANNLDTDMTNKIDDNHTSLDVKIEPLQINNNAELCNHTKHIASQHETHMDNTNTYRRSTR